MDINSGQAGSSDLGVRTQYRDIVMVIINTLNIDDHHSRSGPRINLGQFSPLAEGMV